MKTHPLSENTKRKAFDKARELAAKLPLATTETKFLYMGRKVTLKIHRKQVSTHDTVSDDGSMTCEFQSMRFCEVYLNNDYIGEFLLNNF